MISQSIEARPVEVRGMIQKIKITAQTQDEWKYEKFQFSRFVSAIN